MPLPTVVLQDSFGDDRTFVTTQGGYAIPYLELPDYRESWARDGVTSTRTCVCLWEDRLFFKDDMLGSSTYVEGNTVGGIKTNLKRTPPEEHPDIPLMYATSCDLVPLGVPTEDRTDLAVALSNSAKHGQYGTYDEESNMIAFNLAQFQVTYTSYYHVILKDLDVPTNDLGELNRYVSVYTVTSAYNQPVRGVGNNSGFTFLSDLGSTGKFITENPAITIPVLEYQYVWKQIPVQYVPYDTIATIVGCVNNATFDDHLGARELLCLAPKVDVYQHGTNVYYADITYIFQKRAYPNAEWNSLYRVPVGAGQPGAGKPGFEQFVFSDGTTKAYPEADFMKLFKLAD